MSMRPDPLAGSATPGVSGAVDYRLARNSVLTDLAAGRRSHIDVCDAQRELLRNASGCGDLVKEPCPVCEERALRHVTYLFGPRLGPGGRCITAPHELIPYRARSANYTAYVVEVCTECRWNHLVRSFPLGGKAETAGTAGGK